MDSSAGDAAAGGRGRGGAAWPPPRPDPIPGGSGKMVIDVMHAGGLVVAGTDTPNAINLHGELMACTCWPA